MQINNFEIRIVPRLPLYVCGCVSIAMKVSATAGLSNPVNKDGLKEPQLSLDRGQIIQRRVSSIVKYSRPIKRKTSRLQFLSIIFRPGN